MNTVPIVAVPGIVHDFGGGRCYVIPPLTLNAFRQFKQRGMNLSGVDVSTDEGLDIIIAATHAALRRNYPHLTIEEVGDLLDYGNFLDVMTSVMDAAGVKRKTIEAEQAAADQGKAQAGETSTTSTGMP